VPNGVVPGQLPGGQHIVTIAEDAQGHKVFVFHSYPASIEQVPGADKTVAGSYEAVELVARYEQPTGITFYYIPILSLRSHLGSAYVGDDIYNSPLTEETWISGIPMLVLDSAVVRPLNWTQGGGF